MRAVYAAVGGLWESTTRPPVSGLGRGDLVYGTYFPDATNTGVDPAITLDDVNTPVIVASPGARVYNKRFLDLVTVRAADVQFINCKFEGPAYEVNGAIIDARHPGVLDLVLEDCTIAPRTPSHVTHAFYGWNVTFRRVDAYGAVDSASLIAPLGETHVNAVFEGCWFHDLSFYSPTNTQSDNITHNDCIQIHGGLGLTIRGCRLEGFIDPTIGAASTPPTGTWPGSHTGGNPFYPDMYATSVLMCAPVNATMGDFLIVDNWVNGGRVAFNLGAAGVVGMPDVGTITGNHFGYDYDLGNDYAVYANPGQTIALTGNFRWNPLDPFDNSISFNVRKAS